MTIIKSYTEVNEVDSSGVLALYVDAALATTYSYNAGEFTLSERPADINIGSVNLFYNIDRIYQWVDLLEKNTGAVISGDPVTVIKVDKELGKVKVKFDRGPDSAIDAKWVKDTGLTLLKARPEIVLTFGEFLRFLFALMLLKKEINNAMKTLGELRVVR